MSPTEWQRIVEAPRRAIEAFQVLSREEQTQRLICSGVLDRHGHLSSSYGGPGEATRRAGWWFDDAPAKGRPPAKVRLDSLRRGRADV